MRAGTSRGPFFLREWLPDGDEARDQALIGAIGASDPLQLDGVGGGSTLNSKVAIVSRSKEPGCDLDYLFAQVGVGHRSVDTRPNCGNMLSGVAPFAIEQGLIAAQDGTTQVRVFNVNTRSRIDVTVRTPGGRVTYEGDARIDGVAGTAAPILLNFLDAWGAVTGQVFPTGQRIDTIDGIEVTCIDAAMPLMIVRASDLGVTRAREAGGAGCQHGAARTPGGAAPAGRPDDGAGRRVEQRDSEAGAGERGRCRRQHHLALFHAAPMPCVACGDGRDRRGQRVRVAGHGGERRGARAGAAQPGRAASGRADRCRSGDRRRGRRRGGRRAPRWCAPPARSCRANCTCRTTCSRGPRQRPRRPPAFPRKAITIIVPTRAGGGNDTMARIIAAKLGPLLGQEVLVDARAGANGAIASEYVAHAAPDGHTLMFGYIGTHAMNPALQKLGYDPVDDFEPVGLVGSSPTMMVAHPDLHVRRRVGAHRAAQGHAALRRLRLGRRRHAAALRGRVVPAQYRHLDGQHDL